MSWLISSQFIIALVVAIAAYLIPDLLLRRGIQRRRLNFQNQLIDVLVMISGSLKAGLSIHQSIDVIIDEMAAPASEEFRRVRREVELGLPFSQTLVNMSQRMDSDDLYLVVTAININTQVGGNLSEILSVIVETIRERTNLFNEIRVLTSYARYAGYVLTALPFITGAILMLLNPVFFGPLLEPGLGRIILSVALIMVLIGNFWIRRLVKFKN
jgi:tight adherence protein B